MMADFMVQDGQTFLFQGDTAPIDFELVAVLNLIGIADKYR